MNYGEKSRILQENLKEMQNSVDWDDDDKDPIEKKMATKEKTFVSHQKPNRGRGSFNKRPYRGRGRGHNNHWQQQNYRYKNFQRDDGFSYYGEPKRESEVNYWHSNYNASHQPSSYLEMSREQPHQFRNTHQGNDSVTPSDSISTVKSDLASSTISTTQNISPSELAKSLCNYGGFKCSLIDLIDDLNYDHKKVKEVAKKNCNIFELDGANIALKPKIKVCDGHIVSEGCQSRLQCHDLHICPSFINDSCTDGDECLLGHFFKTNHNKNILGKHFMLDFQSPILKNIFQEIFNEGDLASGKEKDLKICLDYINTKCSKSECTSLHMCLDYLANICSKKGCSLNHLLAEKSTASILKNSGISMNESPRDIICAIKNCPEIKKEIESLKAVLSADTTVKSDDSAAKQTDNPVNITPKKESQEKKIQKTIWSDHLVGELSTYEEICYNSVESYCSYEDSGCWRLHCDKHFHWQVKEKGKPWMNLPRKQIMALEFNFCDPNINNFDLPPLDQASLTRDLKGILKILRGKSVWKVDFEKMGLLLQDSNNTYKLSLRRLHTEYIKGVELPDCCNYIWYFNDINKKWIEYGQVDSTGEATLKCSVTSNDIEKHRMNRPNSPLAFQSNKFSYILDTIKFEQTNLKTNVIRVIRRRPKSHLGEEAQLVEGTGSLTPSPQFPHNWDPMKSEVRLIRVPLQNTSQEYKTVSAYVQQKQGTFTIISIERIQNQFLYFAFQNKLKNMKTIYNNEKDLNIQQLFHGTSSNIVDSICDQNFDWRLHGSSSGQSFGRGTYFATSAQYSYGYARQDQNNQENVHC